MFGCGDGHGICFHLHHIILPTHKLCLGQRALAHTDTNLGTRCIDLLQKRNLCVAARHPIVVGFSWCYHTFLQPVPKCGDWKISSLGLSRSTWVSSPESEWVIGTSDPKLVTCILLVSNAWASLDLIVSWPETSFSPSMFCLGLIVQYCSHRWI